MQENFDECLIRTLKAELHRLEQENLRLKREVADLEHNANRLANTLLRDPRDD